MPTFADDRSTEYAIPAKFPSVTLREGTRSGLIGGVGSGGGVGRAIVRDDNDATAAPHPMGSARGPVGAGASGELRFAYWTQSGSSSGGSRAGKSLGGCDASPREWRMAIASFPVTCANTRR